MSDFKFSTEPFLDSDQAAAILRIHPKESLIKPLILGAARQ